MLGIKIKELRKEKGLTLDEVAAALKTSKQTIHKYEKGIVTNIPHDKIVALAEVLGTTPSELMGWESYGYDNVRPITVKKLPVLGAIACGEPIYAEQCYEGYATTSGNLDADFCLVAKGDSMTGARIFDGDILFVRKQDSVDDGDIAVVLIDDEATVKRVYFDRENGILTLIPENPTYKPMRYMGSRLDSIRILGKVVSGQYKI